MIIKIAGLPGSGKSSLTDLLGDALGYKTFHIDEYRNKYRNEFKTMHALFKDMYECGDNFILDSAGFNPRMLWVFMYLKPKVVEIKLTCEKAVLYERIEKKTLSKEEWFPYLSSRKEFIDMFFVMMERKHAEIVIDTSYITPKAALKCALDGLNLYK